VNTGLAGLSLLEEKIEKAARLIETLRREKKEIEETSIELKQKLDSLYISNEKLMKRLEELEKERNNQKDREKTREEINNKIEEMLAKLEELEV